ncbi:hypothetical protein [Chromatium okenii]|jgi:hypothetical protein|uniref:hypothetical protein n=1 Tax=Chromatium okenii TaxID=61644 RepID=UPI0026EAE70F|nr:hypothetical protein [Chromatium okenii]MBV5309268.1 hypothetical protein [Chromatium okenii]
MEFLQFATDVGFPIAAACGGIYFVFLTQKFLLDSVLERIQGLIAIIRQLDKRITSMSQDIIRIDALMSEALDIAKEKEKNGS